MSKKILLTLFAVIALIGVFIPSKISAQDCGGGYPECANDCTACWVNSDCSYGGCWEDTNCGNCYVPPPPQVCNPGDRCERAYLGSNFCCNNIPNNWTPNPTGNNVCNYEYWWYCNNSGTACDQGPYAYQLNTVPHPCTNQLSCGICSPGQTQTETRFNNNCATSTCGVNSCAREVEKQERSRTCNVDCGGWGGWSGWNTVDSYPECPANNECGTSSQSGSSCYSPPGHTHTYGCVNNSCAHTDTGSNTDSNCGGSCSVPPPPPPPQTRYSCSGSSCVVNASGPYTVAGCGGACTAPPGGCSVGWTLSNENPQPNSSIQVKVRGISDPQGWQNIRLTLDGSNTGNLAWPPENPWPTFVYNNVPTNSGGGHTLEFRTNNGSRTCAPSKTFTTQSPPPPPPTCTNTTPGVNQLTGCLWDGVSFNTVGGNAPPGSTSDPINNPLIPPAGDIVYSATALNQDWGLGGPPPPNDFVGNDTFSARWRGNFTFKKGTYTFKIGSDDGVRLKVDGVERIDIPPGKSWRDQAWDFLDKYTAQVVFDSQRTVPLELEYYENGGQAKITLSWNYTPPVTLKPWIQTIGGDVHSNVSINMRGN